MAASDWQHVVFMVGGIRAGGFLGANPVPDLLSCLRSGSSTDFRVDRTGQPYARPGGFRSDCRPYGSVPGQVPENADTYALVYRAQVARPRRLSISSAGLCHAAPVAVDRSLLWQAFRLFRRRGPLGARRGLRFRSGGVVFYTSFRTGAQGN